MPISDTTKRELLQRLIQRLNSDNIGKWIKVCEGAYVICFNNSNISITKEYIAVNNSDYVEVLKIRKSEIPQILANGSNEEVLSDMYFKVESLSLNIEETLEDVLRNLTRVTSPQASAPVKTKKPWYRRLWGNW